MDEQVYDTGVFDAASHRDDRARPVLGAGELRALVCRAAAAFDPDTVAPETAERVMREWATIEHAAATAKAMAAARAATGAAVRDAGRRDAAECEVDPAVCPDKGGC